MRRTILIAAAVTIGAIPAVAFGGAQAKGLEAYMSNATEVPKASAKASGEAHITFTATSVCWKFTDLKGVAGATAAHIHKGVKGKSGGVVVPFGAAFKATGCIRTAAAVMNAIKKNPAGYYVNVHTAKYPGGAIRGQLAPGD